MCGESRLHGVERGKTRRLYQGVTYRYVFQNSTTKKIWKSDTKESAPADTEQSPHLFTLCTKTEKLEYRATDTLAPALRVITISDSI